MKKIAIIGGGITGLSAAYAVKRARDEGADIDYILLEKNPRLGGKILTERTDDGFVVEGGPDCFISTKPWVFELSRKLGCEGKLMGSNDEVKKTYILVNNKLREMPDGIMVMVPTKIMPFLTTDLFSWPGKMRMAMDWFIPKKKDPGDESLASFVSRRLGKEALDRIAEPLVAGIHAGDPDTMSLAATFPNLLEMEQKHGSLIKGMLAAMKSRHGHPPQGAKPGGQGNNPGSPPTAGPKRTFFMTFKGGMLDIIDELYGVLDKDKVLLSTGVLNIEELKEESSPTRYRLQVSESKVIEADAIIFASPSRDTADLVDDIDKELAVALREIPAVSSATVSVAYRKKDVKHDFKGFGFIIPIAEGRKIMACTWSSSKWNGRVPNDDYVIVRAFVGGARSQHLATLSDEEMKATVKAELKDLMGIDAEPVNIWIFRWPNGMPQYTMGHLDRLKKIDKHVAHHPGIFLAGGSYRGIGVPDCINSGIKAAEGAKEYLISII